MQAWQVVRGMCYSPHQFTERSPLPKWGWKARRALYIREAALAKFVILTDAFVNMTRVTTHKDEAIPSFFHLPTEAGAVRGRESKTWPLKLSLGERVKRLRGACRSRGYVGICYVSGRLAAQSDTTILLQTDLNVVWMLELGECNQLLVTDSFTDDGVVVSSKSDHDTLTFGSLSDQHPLRTRSVSPKRCSASIPSVTNVDSQSGTRPRLTRMLNLSGSFTEGVSEEVASPPKDDNITIHSVCPCHYLL